MICPSCNAENAAGATACRGCGIRLFSFTEGSLLAGRYEILKSLGQGGMGVVYKARDRVLDELVAIKVLRSDVAVTPELGRRFLSEIKLARKVTHKNVCRIHEYGQYDGLNYISMEYVDGVDLKHILGAEGALAPARAFDVALQVAHGLHAIHEQGIVHRDLKAPNIMLDAAGTVRLMDFGIAKDSADEGAQNMTATGMIVGTPEYMSPEQARGVKLDGRSDVYALGVVIYELFTGDVPFRGDTPIATIIQHLQSPPPLERSDIPPAMVPVLHAALAKEPSDRYATALDLATALTEARDATFPGRGATPRPLPTVDVPRAAGGFAGRPVTTPPATQLPTPMPMPTPRPMHTRAPMPQIKLAPSVARPHTPTLAEGVRPAPKPASRVWLWLLVAVGVGGMAVTAVVIVMLAGRGSPTSASPPPTLAAASPRPAATTALATPLPAETTLAPSTTTVPVTLAPTTAPPPPVTVPATVAATVPPATRPTPEPTPVPARVDGGFLQLVVVPWAEVTVDGNSVTTAPLRKIPLSEGSHMIRLEHPDYQPLQRKVTIRPGQTLSLTVDLPEEAIRRKK